MDILGDDSLWVSHISTCLVGRGHDSLYFRQSFQGQLYIHQPWKTETVFPLEGKGYSTNMKPILLAVLWVIKNN